MLEIILHTPIYVWPLLAYTLFVGIKALKPRTAPLKMLLIIPALFISWSTYALLSRYGLDPSIVGSWILKMTIGIYLGYSMTNKLSLRFDKEKQLVELPGSLHSLLALLLLFSIRYSLGIVYAIHPEWQGHHVLLAFEGVAGVIAGSLIGRVLNILKRYKTASHESLA